ncbi:MAG: NYN domain-containing protein [Ktedonobacteraceae bacterium]|nr:NYN domain-containing protein [Ktedonobacteraceae bacterium]MBO0797136.1 NYN domain-containing protein [Ktedonobacteraceae bacterium]
MEDMQERPSTASDVQQEMLLSRVGRMLLRRAHRFLALLQTAQVEVVALLIDGENISPDIIAPALLEAGKFGGVMIRRLYGNIASPAMQRWKEVMPRYGLQGMHQAPIVSGKNTADIALTVDAMDLFYREQVTRFCLVTSDSDYTAF